LARRGLWTGLFSEMASGLSSASLRGFGSSRKFGHPTLSRRAYRVPSFIQRSACLRGAKTWERVLAMRSGLALAVAFGAVLASPVSARNLPSDVEQYYGIPPNSANRDRGRGRYRNPPSDWEQQRRRAYHYQRYYGHRHYRPTYRYYYRY